MVKRKPMYCYGCGERTVHSYVGKESAYEGSGLIRCFAAVISFGASETSLADHYWQCERCGHIKKK